MRVGLSEEKDFWRRLWVLWGLGAAAVTAPLLDIYGRNPEVFVANRASGVEIALFGLIVTLAVPAVALVVLLVASRLGERATERAHAALVAVLALGVGLVVSRQVLGDNTVGAVVTALALAALLFLADRWFSRALAYFALALPVALGLFLTTSASARLIWEESEPPARAAHVSRAAPLVMIQLDEMPTASIMEPDGTINETLFPSFARLAAEGTWYRNAFSNSIATTQSVPAILTGRLGEKGMSPSSVDHPDNMFSLLAGTYEMHVIEWIADLCPDEVCPEYAGPAPARFGSLLRDVGVVYGHLTMPAAVREELPSIDNAWKGFLGQEGRTGGARVDIEGLPVPDRSERVRWVDWVERLIEGVEPGAPPTLHYAHLEAPHVPWKTNPSGTHYERPEDYTEVEGVEGDGRWATDPRPALMGFQRHLYQVGFLDRVLGRLFDRLEEAGVWDDAMVVVVSDHGASFEPGQHRRWPYEDNRDDLYRIPLFIKYPAQSEGEVVDTPAYGIDVLPTIVDALGIETTWEFDGVSLLDDPPADRPHEVVWWCCSTEGAGTELDTLYRQVGRNHDRVPDQGSWEGVAGAGRHAALIGEPTGSLDVTEVPGLRWSLDLGASLEDLDRGSGMVQTLLTGRVELGGGLEADTLLVSVNGRVGGMGYVLRDSESGGVLRALIAEEMLEDGRNEIELLLSAGGDRWLAGSADEITLELARPDGRILDLRSEGSRRVQVDEVEATADGWVLEGWAADVTRKVTPDAMYVFVGPDLVATRPPDVENQNVVRWFDSDDLLLSGFSLEVRAEDVPEGVDQVTVVAEFGDVAVADPVFLTPRPAG